MKSIEAWEIAFRDYCPGWKDKAMIEGAWKHTERLAYRDGWAACYRSIRDILSSTTETLIKSGKTVTALKPKPAGEGK